MQTTVATQITIAARTSAVFEYLSHLKYHHLWNPQLVSLSTYEPLKLGSVYMAESRLLGISITASNVITKFQPPGEITIENSIGNVQYSVRFRLTGQGNSTIVKLSTVVTTELALYGLTLPVLKKLALRELRIDLQALKLAVESHLE